MDVWLLYSVCWLVFNSLLHSLVNCFEAVIRIIIIGSCCVRCSIYTTHDTLATTPFRFLDCAIMRKPIFTSNPFYTSATLFIYAPFTIKFLVAALIRNCEPFASESSPCVSKYQLDLICVRASESCKWFFISLYGFRIFNLIRSFIENI